MKRTRGTAGPRWTIDAYETDAGEAPAWSFIQKLEGRNKVEAIALVKLLEEGGILLRRPQSGALGDGRVIVLLGGETKKRDDIPPRTLSRMRVLQAEVASRGAARGIRRAKR